MNILNVRDRDGNWVGIPAIQGPKGKDGTMSFQDLTEEQRESLRGPAGKDGRDGENGLDGQPGPQGADGFSPTVTLDPIDDGTRITIADASGDHSFEVKNGRQGPQGPKGDAYEITDADYSMIADVVLTKMTNAEKVRY